MADIAGLAVAIIALVDSCLTVSKLVINSKDFPLESKTLRLGLVGERARLKTWARDWKIPVDTSLTDPVQIGQHGTNLLEEEAKAANLDLEEVQDILDNMCMLLTKGKAMENRHHGRSVEVGKNSISFRVKFSTLRRTFNPWERN
jgi:Prion-inhibition and propagation